MKKENISLPKAFIAKQEEFEKWVEEEETSKDEGLNVKGLMDLVNDALDDSLNTCDIDSFHVVKESKMKSQNIFSTRQGQEHICYLGSG